MMRTIYHYNADDDTLTLIFPVDVEIDDYIFLDDDIILCTDMEGLPRRLIVSNVTSLLNIDDKNALYEKFIQKVALSIANFTGDTVYISVKLWSRYYSDSLYYNPSFSLQYDNVSVAKCNEHLSISL